MALKTDYDHITLFNPEGRVIPLTHIKRSVELGNTCIGIHNKKIGIILAYTGKLNPNEYKAKKIFKIQKCIFSFSGITNDGLKIVEYLNKKYLNTLEMNINPHPIHIFKELAIDASRRTIMNSDRLLGCAGIFCCYNNGVRMSLFEPNGDVVEVRAIAVGNRSQAAKTILENEIDKVEDMDVNELIELSIRALKNTYSDEEVCEDNVEIWGLRENCEPEIVDSKYFFQ
ncbi:putative proteasome subunit alpha type-6 [Dictyocoela muelleri]|nr:putative proteasome subunit alpha type-6 [Dictyocoela muelleri]